MSAFLGKAVAVSLVGLLCTANVAESRSLGAGRELLAATRTATVTQKLYDFNRAIYIGSNSDPSVKTELDTKMSKMATSPFIFFRGTDHLFFDDMAAKTNDAYFIKYNNAATNITSLEGDLHLANFGAFEDSAGNVVFDFTDWDEAYFGSYLWDLRRLATSIFLAARELNFPLSDARSFVTTMSEAYLDAMHDWSGLSGELGYKLTETSGCVSGTSNCQATTGEVQNCIIAAKGKSRTDLLTKWTTASGTTGRTFTLGVNGVTAVSSTLKSAVTTTMGSSYRSSLSTQEVASYYNVKDVAQRFGAGTGSLGRLRLYVLIEGKTTSNTDDRILEVKEEMSAAAARAAPGRMPSTYYGGHEGRRVQVSLKAQSTGTDPLAGYVSIAFAGKTRPFYVHERIPKSEDFDYLKLTTTGKWTTAMGYIGTISARSHAQADQDYWGTSHGYSIDKQVDLLTDTRHDDFNAALVNFAEDYYNQVVYDYNSFVSQRNAGVAFY